MSKYRYVIPNKERAHHLVISKEMHEAIKYYAKKWGKTITETTQILLLLALKNEVKDTQEASRIEQ